MWHESGQRPDIPDNHNPDGTVDRGLMQINSQNWAWLREDGFDVDKPRDNIAAGVAILAGYLNRYDGDIEYALTAYACGPAGAEQLDGRSAVAEEILMVEVEEVSICSPWP